MCIILLNSWKILGANAKIVSILEEGTLRLSVVTGPGSHNKWQRAGV